MITVLKWAARINCCELALLKWVLSLKCFHARLLKWVPKGLFSWWEIPASGRSSKAGHPSGIFFQFTLREKRRTWPYDLPRDGIVLAPCKCQASFTRPVLEGG